jgi:cysteine-rich repeat protein
MLRNSGSITLALCMAAGLSMVACSDDDSGTVCGDGVIEGSEVCDGMNVSGRTCSDEGFLGGELSCNTACDGLDTSGCNADVCGDGEITGMEDCEGTDLNSYTCQDLNFDGGDLSCNNCSFDDSGCTTGCTDNCTAEDDTQCTGDVLGTCTVGADGCLDWVDTDCTTMSQICDDGGATALCADNCTSNCTTLGDTECIDANNLNTCTDSGNGCMNWTASTCTGGTCDDTTPPAACATDGTGDSCLDAIVLSTFPAQFTGTDITADFPTDNHDFNSGTDCSGTTSSGMHPEAVFRVDLAAGDTLIVSEHTNLDAVLHIVAADVTDCLVTTQCLDSTDGGETTGINYEATGSETVYVVIEPWSSAPSSVEYDLLIQLIPTVCGDGIVSSAETCDDGNTVSGDGCSDDCATVEAGYQCAPGFCYATGTGDICGAGNGGPAIPLTPGSYAFDTTGFTNDYDDYNGACGVNKTGAGPDAIFEVTVPAGDFVEVVNTDSVNFDGVAVLADDCADIMGSCLDWSDTPEEVAYYNDTGAAKSVFFIIDGWGSTGEGLFQFTVNLVTPVCGNGTLEPGETCDDSNTTPGDGCSDTCMFEGDTCADPIELPASGGYAGSFDTTGLADDYGISVGTNYDACGGDGGYGPDLIFTAIVPAGDVLDATVLSQTFTAALVLATDCAALEGSCTSYEEGSSGDLHGSWTNTTGSAATVFIIVDSGYGSSNQQGQFDLQLNTRTPVCGDGVIDGTEACDDGNTAPSDGCDASCTVESGFVCSSAPSFCYATGTGDICGAGNGGPAIPLTPGSYAFDTTGFTNDYDDYNGACGTNKTGAGPDAIFEINVPDGGILEVVNTDSVSFDGVVVFADDCTDIMGSCLDWSDTPEEVAYQNNTGAAKTIYFIIDGWSSSSEGIFQFTLNLETPICGNGAIEAGEACDDGNVAPNDGCSATCQPELFACYAGETHVTIVSTDVPVAIVSSSTVTSTVTVPNTGTVVRAMVTFTDIAHTWDSDLDISLISPTTTAVELTSDNGGGSDNYTGTLFDDACAGALGLGPITGGSAPFTGCYSPEESLSTFAGEAASGVWTLSVHDDTGGDSGSVNGWTLDLCIQ